MGSEKSFTQGHDASHMIRQVGDLMFENARLLEHLYKKMVPWRMLFDTGLRASDFGFRVKGFGFRVRDYTWRFLGT